MEISEHNIIWFFHEYNQKYFGGVLPFPELKIRHSYRILGYFSCEYDTNGKMFNQCIEISDNYDYLDNQFRDILIHEMVHYYLAYVGIDVECHHGMEFLNMAEKFNKDYNMNITPTIDLSQYLLKKGKSFLMFKLSTIF